MEFTAIQMAQAAQKAAEAEANELRAHVKGLQAHLKQAQSHLATSRTSNAELMADRERDKNEIIKLDRDVAIARDQRDHANAERDAATSYQLRMANARCDALNAQNKELQADSVKLQVAEQQVAYLRDDVAAANELKRKLAIAEQDVARMRVERESEMDATRADNTALQQQVNALRIDLNTMGRDLRAAQAEREIAANAWRADDTKWHAEERKLRDELARINPYARAWLAYEHVISTRAAVADWKAQRARYFADGSLDLWFTTLLAKENDSKNALQYWGEAEEAAQAAWKADKSGPK